MYRPTYLRRAAKCDLKKLCHKICPRKCAVKLKEDNGDIKYDEKNLLVRTRLYVLLYNAAYHWPDHSKNGRRINAIAIRSDALYFPQFLSKRIINNIVLCLCALRQVTRFDRHF